MSASLTPIANMMTVDVEDYFQVSGFESVVPRTSWSSYETRVEGSPTGVSISCKR